MEEDRREEERESGAFILKNKKKPDIKTTQSKLLLIPPNKATSVNSTVVTPSTAPVPVEIKEEEPETSVNQLIDGEALEIKGDDAQAP